MAHPLQLSYQWQLPLTFATVGLVVCVGVLSSGRAPGWVGAATVLVAIWAAFVGLVWVRTRAHLLLDGPRLEVRQVRTLREVEAAQVVAVRQVRTTHGLSYRLRVGDAGQLRSVTVPTALLRGGAAALLGWILIWAPQAQLDRGAQATVARLRHAGLIELEENS
jgi:hypothetical protein